MRKRRMIWGLMLIILFVNSILSESEMSIYIFFGALMIPLASTAVTAVAVKDVAVQIELPKTCSKGQEIKGIIHLASKGFLPIFKGVLEVKLQNLLTMECRKEFLSASFDKAGECLAFTLQNRHCGVVELSVENIAVSDPFGLWEKHLQTDVAAQVTVLPDTFDLHLELAQSNMANNDSIEYAQNRTGNDMSEIFAIREYQEGDSIRSIHWKLSSKCDDLMVKLASLPMENSLLLLMETALGNEEEIQPDVFDALAEIYITISQTLVDNEIAHKAAWFDQESQTMFTFSIDDEDDLHGIMGKTLSMERRITGKHAVESYLDAFSHFEQAHVIYVTHRDSGCLAQTDDELIKTVIVCSDKGDRAGGPYDYSCTSKDYQLQLRTMTI